MGNPDDPQNTALLKIAPQNPGAPFPFRLSNSLDRHGHIAAIDLEKQVVVKSPWLRAALPEGSAGAA
jgi:hypothetical protein